VHPIEPGCSVASLRLLNDTNSIEVKKAIEEELIRPLCGRHPFMPFFKGGRFVSATTKHPFVGVRRW